MSHVCLPNDSAVQLSFARAHSEGLDIGQCCVLLPYCLIVLLSYCLIANKTRPNTWLHESRAGGKECGKEGLPCLGKGSSAKNADKRQNSKMLLTNRQTNQKNKLTDQPTNKLTN